MGLHFIVAGSSQMFSAAEELRKQIQASNYGVGLQNADSAGKLNGRVPRSLAETELPPGRGFNVKSGRTVMVQIATPYSSDDNIEGSLDSWIDQIQKLHPEPQVKWLRVPEPVAPKGGDGGAPAKPGQPTYDIELLKTRLKAKGLGADLLAALGPDDIYKVAVQFGLDKAAPEEKVPAVKPSPAKPPEPKPAAEAKAADQATPEEKVKPKKK